MSSTAGPATPSMAPSTMAPSATNTSCRDIQPLRERPPKCNTLTEPHLYNLGMIPQSATALRLAQGLDSQELANACAGHNTRVCGVLMPDVLYPITFPGPEYGPENHIPEHCSCLQYVRAP